MLINGRIFMFQDQMNDFCGKLNANAKIALLRKKHIPYEICERKTLDRMSDNKNHQGVIAETEDYKLFPLEALLKEENGLIVALDSLKDPQNLGTIVRTVDVAGADGITFVEAENGRIVFSAACGEALALTFEVKNQ